MTENTPEIELKVTLSPESAPSGNFYKMEKVYKEEWCEKETGSGIQKELKVNVVPGSNAGSTFDLKLGLEKKRKLFKEEKLSLVCEWAGCGETETNPDIFNCMLPNIVTRPGWLFSVLAFSLSTFVTRCSRTSLPWRIASSASGWTVASRRPPPKRW